MTNPTKKLRPARNGAVYPTLEDVGLDRRFLLASVGAAALAVGLSCSTAGAMIIPADPFDASVDAPPDAALPLDSGQPDEDAGDAPDGSPPEVP